MGSHRRDPAWRAGGFRALAVVTGSVAAVALVSGTAAAYWTSSGSGTGSAAAGTISLTANASVGSSLLYPGGSVAISVAVTNPADSATLNVTGVSATSVTADSGHSGCDTSAVTYQRSTALPVSVVAGGSPVDVDGSLAMAADAADACQGATFSVTLSVNGQLG